jgi:hypothetical protein
MSKVLSDQTYLIATALGNVAVTQTLVTDYSVEDIMRGKAEAQAKALQMINIGKELDGNPDLPVDVLPTMFADVNTDGGLNGNV